jgi:hypothetical protein
MLCLKWEWIGAHINNPHPPQLVPGVGNYYGTSPNNRAVSRTRVHVVLHCNASGAHTSRLVRVAVLALCEQLVVDTSSCNNEL